MAMRLWWILIAVVVVGGLIAGGLLAVQYARQQTPPAETVEEFPVR
jgi:hypothetical protein